MKILSEKQIQQKIKRLSIEILEQNYNASEIVLAGINNNGLHFAKLLHKSLIELTKIPCVLTTLHLNPRNPVTNEITLDVPAATLKGKVVVVVDDVANTGRTLFYAMYPLMSVLPKKVQVAVLVDRKHKSFPIQVDYVGLSLATTLKDNIQVAIKEVDEMNVYLE
ncbi:MAG: phosphoribosyltransferase [Saprospiraceae bacterium]|nr:phosphoribosyltransferase [Saprospiraceae bacterium]